MRIIYFLYSASAEEYFLIDYNETENKSIRQTRYNYESGWISVMLSPFNRIRPRRQKL